MQTNALRELPIAAYLDRFSGGAGDTIRGHVSLASPGPFTCTLERIICADPNPAGPGLRIEDLGDLFSTTLDGRHQPIEVGSYARVPLGPPRADDDPYTWSALFWLRQVDAVSRPLIAETAADGGLVIAVSESGVSARLGASPDAAAIELPEAIRPLTWYRAWLSHDPRSGEAVLGLCAATGATTPPAVHATRGRLGAPLRARGAIFFAAAGDGSSAKFDGKIEQPVLLNGWRESWDAPFEDPEGTAVLALWDFSIGIDTQTVTDRGPHGCHGELRNLPMRGVRGVRWTGEEMCWRHAPGHYGAIQFASDMVGDCGWSPDFAFEVPADLPSGAYAFRLDCADGFDRVPFYVTPTPGGAARILFLAPTFTYQIYANHARGNFDAGLRARTADWGAYPHNPDDYPVYGRSTYNLHPDGSGIAYSSRLRPMLTVRPGFLTFDDPHGSGLRHYPADSHILAWLESQGFAFDVTTDGELDRRGVEALGGYDVVITGTHPEYYTGAMLDGLRAHVEGGGNLIYTGGNGFYWKIAVGRHGAEDALEVRRAEGGVRKWATEPGEAYQAFDGAYGGLWRRNGRPPQQLVGVGFSAQGLFEAGWFRRTEASHDPALAWVFEGVEGERLGDYGLSAGGAAGFELDRVDPELGTPPGTVVLARSEGLPEQFFPATEELLVTAIALNGQPVADLVRGDMTYVKLPGGGRIFSAGSITFAGSLWRDGFDGPVSRLLRNVVADFTRPR